MVLGRGQNRAELSFVAEMAKCKKRDGSLCIGPTPPEDCVPLGSGRVL